MELTELCQELKNWFDIERTFGEFEISDGEISLSSLQENQYYRIVGSVFNDGVHKYGEGGLTDEVFNGAIWSMAVPPSVLSLVDKITEWEGKYGDASLSPYSSESFGGYSYTKSSGSNSNGSYDGGTDYRSIFRNELNKWRKV